MVSLIVTDLRDPYSGENRGVIAEKYDSSAIFPAIRLERDGAVAFVDWPITAIGQNLAACNRVGGMRKRVRVWDAHTSKPRIVDSGRTIAPHTLELKGSRLTWKHGKRLRHASLSCRRRQTRINS